MDFSEIRDQINDVVDMKEVAQDMLGLPTKVISGRTNILCPLPGHNDKDFGSCVLRKTNGYCFACNESFNAIDLVMLTKDCSFMQAVKDLAEFYDIKLNLDREEEADPPIVISADVLRFAGIADSSAFKKLFTEDRETAWRYLALMVANARNKLRSVDKNTLPSEISEIVSKRIKALEKTDSLIPKWRMMPGNLRIK